ncbi:MAG: helix-turn-helix transcriptional regulator [Candidatus Levybacteria bacterium]|nr:helix-turn-helix transcriptional regulator [Candidatus Levybacteria bacterium]
MEREARRAARGALIRQLRLENAAIQRVQAKPPLGVTAVVPQIADQILELPREVPESRQITYAVVIMRERIRTLRKEGDETVQAVAVRTGSSVDTIRSAELGRRIPNAKTLVMLAKAYNTSVSFLVGEVHDRRQDAVERVSELPLNETITGLVRQRGLHLSDLSISSALSPDLLLKIQTGSSPGLLILEKLAFGLGVPIGRLFGEQPIKKQ